VPLTPQQREAVARTQREIDALVAEVADMDATLVLPPETIEKIVQRVMRQLGSSA
jgi:hypothetical protein